MPWQVLSLLVAMAAVIAFVAVARLMLSRGDDYQSEGMPSSQDLWTRGGYGDPGPGG